MYIINLDCDKKSFSVDVTGESDDTIKELVKRYHINGVNIIKII